MDHTELKKEAWREAATGGLYAGVCYALLMIATYVLRGRAASLAQVLDAVSFFLLGGMFYFYAARVRSRYARCNEMFTFGRSWGFIVQMSLFAGVVVGVGNYILATWIDPEYVRRTVDMMVNAYIQRGGNEELYREAGATTARMLGNPIFMVLGGVVGMSLYGALLGLVVSVFARSKRVDMR